MTFLNRVRQTITDYNLIRNGDTIIIGVSGGADSTALLDVLQGWQGVMGLKIIVGHIHHGLRKDADADQKFVKNLCAQNRIPCETIRVRIIRKPSESIEELAREKRFAALKKLAKKYHADAIALAHHQDDLAETVLMRLIRGTGLQGLCGILPGRMIDGVRFIRPFLHVTRSDIENFLKKRNIPYRTDPTNSDTAFFRNTIRLQLMPLLKRHYNPKIASVLAGLAETSGMDYDFLSTQAQEAFHRLGKNQRRQSVSFLIDDLNRLHPALLRAVLRCAIQTLKGNTRSLTLHHIQTIERFLKTEGKGASQMRFPHGFNIHKHHNTLRLSIARPSRSIRTSHCK